MKNLEISGLETLSCKEIVSIDGGRSFVENIAYNARVFINNIKESFKEYYGNFDWQMVMIE